MSADPHLDAEAGPTPSKIVPRSVREAIAKVNADCKRLAFGADNNAPLWTIYQILGAAREQGVDLGEAMTTAMFGDGYQLSHQRRLLAIALARALPEIASLASELSSARAELAALRSSLETWAAVEPRRELAMGAGVRGQALGMACYTDATLAPDEMKLYQGGRIMLRVTGLRVEAAAPVAVSPASEKSENATDEG